MKKHYLLFTALTFLLLSAVKLQAQVGTYIVFEEHFDGVNFEHCWGWGSSDIGKLPLGGTHGTTTYTYSMNPSYSTLGLERVSGLVSGLEYCGYTDPDRPNPWEKQGWCDINEEEYAIVKNSGLSWWCGRTMVNEHTETANSGAMLINASTNTNQYFYTLNLTGLCPNTKYEFSAWYVSLANSTESYSNIDFQIYEGGSVDINGLHSGGNLIINSNTGNFGGTAGIGDPNATSFVWRQKVLTFTTPTISSISTQYYLKLKNDCGEWKGNDLMIDDIVVTKYIPPAHAYEEGTTNITASVCSSDPINLEVFLTEQAKNEITGGNPSAILYYQWMVLDENEIWETVGIPTTSPIHSVDPGGEWTTKYFRAKISTDEDRAADIDASLLGCFNDAISYIFKLDQTGTLVVSTNPTNPMNYICPDQSINLVGVTSEASHWGWVKKNTGLPADTVGMTYSTLVSAKTITVDALNAGTYYFVAYTGICRDVKELTVEVLPNPVVKFVKDTVCPENGNSFPFNGKIYTVTGNYLDTVKSSFSCDSIIYNINLLFPPVTPPTVLPLELCIGDTELPAEYQADWASKVTFPLTMGNHTFQRDLVSKNGCDSVAKLDLTVNPKLTRTDNKTICEGDIYYFYGMPYSTPQSGIVHSFSNLVGCDSVVTLNLSVNTILTETFNVTVCEGEQIYLMCADCPDFSTYPPGNYTFYDTLPSLNGCDSIITLNLTINPKLTKTITKTICEGDIYDFYGTLYSTSQSGIEKIISNTGGCDSVITLNLTVTPEIITNESLTICYTELPYSYHDTIFGTDTKSDIYTFISGCENITLDLQVVRLPDVNVDVPQVCADVPFFTIFINTVTDYSHYFTDYSITFNAKAIAAGFVNQTGTVNGTEIHINLPANVYPDTYGFTLTLSNNNDVCPSKIIEGLVIDILYPNTIMEQKWYDVIALLKKEYNGGYEFKGYQWYKNEDMMAGENYSYIYIPNGTLNTADCYRVEITRTDDTKRFSCCFFPHDYEECCEYPIVIQEDGMIHISSLSNNTMIRVWTVTGILLQSQKVVNASEYVFVAPAQQGVYLLDVLSEEKRFRKVFPIVVR